MSNPARPVVLLVDDDANNLRVLSEILQPHYRVLAANSGPVALHAVAGEPRPDLVLLDIMMPGMDGHEVLRRLRKDPATADIPVMFVTAMAEAEDIDRGLELGAADYLTKPLIPIVVKARVRTQLEAKQARDWLLDQKTALEAEVGRRMRENDLMQRASVRALAYLAELRDMETGNHILRTEGYVHRLALMLRDHPRFRDTLTDRYIDMVVRSAPLHDIGKVGIPDQILRKPGRLTDAEWEVMRTHARLGREAIEHAEQDLGAPIDFLATAKDIAHWHHERWDGTGYPDGLAGDAIPVSARLMAIADVFDALISKRVYKPKLPYDQAREIIAKGRGRHFDPDMTDAFLAGFDAFVAIAERYRDDGEDEDP